MGVLADQVRVLSERSSVTLLDVTGVGKTCVFQNNGSRLYEWANKIWGHVLAQNCSGTSH